MSRRRRRHRGRSWAGSRPRGEPGDGDRPGTSRGRKQVFVAAACILLVVLAGVCAAVLWPRSGTHAPRAVIIDELSVTDPNPAFVQQATDLLHRQGLTVDYYGGDRVTVDLYRHLANHQYKYIIMRSHSYGQRRTAASSVELGFVGLFTSERYSSHKHVQEQQAGTLDEAFFPAKQDRYFGINQNFIQSLSGRFDGATVILMGCDGLSSDGMARAFVEKGAAAFVSWDREVSAAHTDAATQDLLQHMLVEGQSAAQAVSQTMATVGPDPAFDSHLVAYP